MAFINIVGVSLDGLPIHPTSPFLFIMNTFGIVFWPFNHVLPVLFLLLLSITTSKCICCPICSTNCRKLSSLCSFTATAIVLIPCNFA